MNYLGKILSQQQKHQVSTFDQAQLHNLYNLTGAESGSQSKRATKSSKQTRSAQKPASPSAANMAQTQVSNPFKRLNGIMLLSGPQASKLDQLKGQATYQSQQYLRKS